MRTVYALAGILAALIFAALLLPARAVTLATDRIADLALHGIRGTLWRGQASVVYRGIDAGRIAWDVEWGALLDAQLGVQWRLDGAGHGLAGRLRRGFDSVMLTVDGRVDAANANPVLGDYDIHVGGTLLMDALTIGTDRGTPMLGGELRWTGGRTTYQLAGQTYNADLPPMVARLATNDGQPVLEALLETDRTPLITARLRNGSVEVGITRRFTVLAGKPWPGNAPAAATVLTVERALPAAWFGGP